MITETIMINGDLIEYDDDLHKYFCNGIECISVTQFIKYILPKKYDGIDEEVLKKAAIRGNRIHATVQLYEDYGLNDSDEEEFKSYLMLKDAWEFEVLDTEKLIVIKYKDICICGRLDLVIKEKGKLGIADIKTTYELDREYLYYQLNLYAIGYEQTYHEQIDLLRAVWLRDKKSAYEFIRLNPQRLYQILDKYIEEKEYDIEKFLK